MFDQELNNIKKTLDGYNEVYQQEKGKVDILLSNLKDKFGIRQLSAAESLLKEEQKSKSKLEKKAITLVEELEQEISELEDDDD